MNISYNWLKWYIPDAPNPEELSDIFTFHLCEVESLDKTTDGDTIFDIKILPNRAHDLLSHQGVARALASILNIKFVDPISKYKIPESKSTNLKIVIASDKCRRYMGRIIRNVKIGPSPEWVVKHLESIGQRSINNIVDATNIVMFDFGQPTHVFDLNKVKGALVARQAKEDETLTTLDGKKCIFKSSDLIITDGVNALAVAGVKGGKAAEVDKDTTDIILEVANFDPVCVRKMSTSLGIRTEGSKRWENNFSPEATPYAMRELSATILEMCPDASFEDIVDIYPQKQEEKKVLVSTAYINKRLGSNFSKEEIENVWKRLNFKYIEKNGEFEINIPFLRIDLQEPYDLVEEVISVLGYDKLEEKLPEIKLESKIDEIFAKMSWARNKLLNDGFSEVMTYVFRDKGEVEVLASASDKKFLRTNLTDGLKESIKLNQTNLPLLGVDAVRVFEIGTVFKKSGEEIHVVYGDKKEIKEMSLYDFCKDMPKDFSLEPRTSKLETKFKMWSLFPFIARDVAVWVPESVSVANVEKVIKENAGELLVKGPDLFDKFSKEGKTSYAFRLVFQSYDRTLTDIEINEIMNKITNKIKENAGWQVR